MKITSMFLLVLLGWLQYSLWFGKNGIHNLVFIKNDIIKQQNTNKMLKRRNNQLIIEINDLVDGKEAIEERARKNLDMIKAGEVFYRLVPGKSKL